MISDKQLWDDFRAAWPLERIRKMILEEYTSAGNKDTFCYWIEAKLEILGSIWGGSSFKFGIYSRNNKEPKQDFLGKTFAENYGWQLKYGKTEHEAFENVRAQILETIDAVQKNELERIDQVDLGDSYKWKIAFHYQNSLDKAPVCVNIFKRKILEIASNSQHGTPVSAMHRTLVKAWNGSDFLQYTRNLWQTHTRIIPGTPEQALDAQTEIINKEDEKVQVTSSDHTEIQYLLLRLGADMGFDVWAARNDRNKQHNGENFSGISRFKASLPLQFDSQTNKTIEHIDVLWLKGNSFTAAFEIESTTSIYSGLLRMSDLITMQPNLNIPLFLVAPDERREKVIAEVNRPTFARLAPPLSEICRFISFSRLKDETQKIKAIAKYVKPEYMTEISESCELDEL